jgi:hypothetical protein
VKEVVEPRTGGRKGAEDAGGSFPSASNVTRPRMVDSFVAMSCTSWTSLPSTVTVAVAVSWPAEVFTVRLYLGLLATCAPLRVGMAN